MAGRGLQLAPLKPVLLLRGLNVFMEPVEQSQDVLMGVLLLDATKDGVFLTETFLKLARSHILMVTLTPLLL